MGRGLRLPLSPDERSRLNLSARKSGDDYPGRQHEESSRPEAAVTAVAGEAAGGSPTGDALFPGLDNRAAIRTAATGRMTTKAAAMKMDSSARSPTLLGSVKQSLFCPLRDRHGHPLLSRRLSCVK